MSKKISQSSYNQIVIDAVYRLNTVEEWVLKRLAEMVFLQSFKQDH